MNNIEKIYFLPGFTNINKKYCEFLDKHNVKYKIRDSKIFILEEIIIYPSVEEIIIIDEILKDINVSINDFFIPRYTINMPPSPEEKIHKEKCLVNYSYIEPYDMPNQPDLLEYHETPILVNCYRKNDFYYVMWDKYGDEPRKKSFFAPSSSEDEIIKNNNFIVTKEYVDNWNKKEWESCKETLKKYPHLTNGFEDFF